MSYSNIILKDKFLRIGKSPIFNEQYEEVGHIHFRHSFSNKCDIYKENRLVSYGKMKWFQLFKTWELFSSDHQSIGKVIQKGGFLKKKFIFKKVNGDVYYITGSITDRKFSLTNKEDEPILRISSLSSIISLQPHTFLLEFLSDEFTQWEGISIIHGIRMLVKSDSEDSTYY